MNTRFPVRRKISPMSDSSEPLPVDPFTQSLIDKLRRHSKRIVFTDGADERVLRVAAELVRLEAAVPILLGDSERIRAMATEAGIDLTFVKVLNPVDSSDYDLFCRYLEQIERYRGVELANVSEVVAQPHYFGALMIQYGHADALVSGNLSVPATVFRSLLHLVKPIPSVPRVFSVAILTAPHLSHVGRDGVLFLADCGLNPSPSSDELASFAAETGLLARVYLGRRSRVALLSHSTKGSAGTDSARLVAGATERARTLVNPEEVDIDGELQADAALDPQAAERKIEHAKHKHSADVLVFPNLDSANIALKLLSHVGGAQVYGQLILGLSRPAAQVSRAVDEASLLGTALAVGVEAIKYHELYPDGEVG